MVMQLQCSLPWQWQWQCNGNGSAMVMVMVMVMVVQSQWQWNGNGSAMAMLSAMAMCQGQPGMRHRPATASLRLVLVSANNACAIAAPVEPLRGSSSGGLGEYMSTQHTPVVWVLQILVLLQSSLYQTTLKPVVIIRPLQLTCASSPPAHLAPNSYYVRLLYHSATRPGNQKACTRGYFASCDNTTYFAMYPYTMVMVVQSQQQCNSNGSGNRNSSAMAMVVVIAMVVQSQQQCNSNGSSSGYQNDNQNFPRGVALYLLSGYPSG